MYIIFFLLLSRLLYFLLNRVYKVNTVYLQTTPRSLQRDFRVLHLKQDVTRRSEASLCKL